MGTRCARLPSQNWHSFGVCRETNGARAIPFRHREHCKQSRTNPLKPGSFLAHCTDPPSSWNRSKAAVSRTAAGRTDTEKARALGTELINYLAFGGADSPTRARNASSPFTATRPVGDSKTRTLVRQNHGFLEHFLLCCALCFLGRKLIRFLAHFCVQRKG